MDTIKINVADFYGIPSYYSVMPECVFLALEKAFINGEQFAIVPTKDFHAMRDAYIRKMA